MKKTRLIACLIIGCCIASQLTAAKDKENPPSDAELSAISARGKLLAKYDQIAWHTTDEMLKSNPRHEGVHGYVIDFHGDSWTIAYGEISPDHSELLIAFETSSNADLASQTWPASGKTISDKGDLFHEFLAMDLARTAMPLITRQYNDSVLSSGDGNYYVYFYPAQTDNASIPMGGDWRFKISGDGTRILEKRQLHASIREDPTGPPKEGAKTLAHFHTHVLSDVPEDTDVMYVLMRHPPEPEYVASKKLFYQIDADGTIHYVGKTDKVLKK